MKVYVVEYGAYSDKYTDSVFTTRALAETYVVERARRGGLGFVERGDMPWDDWVRRMDPGSWGAVGYIEEYELWDVVPVLDGEDLVAPKAEP